eukprot:9896827-Alexandrium_andersonii.AAC.1
MPVRLHLSPPVRAWRFVCPAAGPRLSRVCPPLEGQDEGVVDVEVAVHKELRALLLHLPKGALPLGPARREDGPD